MIRPERPAHTQTSWVRAFICKFVHLCYLVMFLDGESGNEGLFPARKYTNTPGLGAAGTMRAAKNQSLGRNWKTS